MSFDKVSTARQAFNSNNFTSPPHPALTLQEGLKFTSFRSCDIRIQK